MGAAKGPLVYSGWPKLSISDSNNEILLTHVVLEVIIANVSKTVITPCILVM